MPWIYTRTITGPPAEDDLYLRRNYINEEFWRRIGNGELHIMLSAPRRVGKSSIMKDLEKTCPEGFLAIYQDIESDKTQEQLFRRLFCLLSERLSRWDRWRNDVKQFLEHRRIGEITSSGIKIERTDIIYKDEVLGLLDIMGQEKIHIVLLLDEFPDVIRAIHKNQGPEIAIDTLNTLRALRHDKRFSNFSLVLAGSVGLHHVIGELGRTKFINDLVPIRIDQLSVPEAYELVHQLIQDASMTIGDKEMEYLIERIGYLLPYYVQLMIEKCDRLLAAEERTDLTVNNIDRAYEEVIREGRNFSDWEKRLTDYLDAEDVKFCIRILTRCAHYGPVAIQELHNDSLRVAPVTSYKELLDEVLEKDGYLVVENNFYQFLSPFLREWWKNRHPHFELDK